MHGVYVGTAASIPVDAIKNAAEYDPHGRVFVLPEVSYLRIASSLRNLRTLSWRLRAEARFVHPDTEAVRQRFSDLADTIDALREGEPAPAEDGPDAQLWRDIWSTWDSGCRGEAFLEYFQSKVREYSGPRVRDPV